MRALWMVAALIGIGILIFAHATVLGTRFLGFSPREPGPDPEGSESMIAWQTSRDAYCSVSMGVTVSSD
jgi:hypothetical protein